MSIVSSPGPLTAEGRWLTHWATVVVAVRKAVFEVGGYPFASLAKWQAVAALTDSALGSAATSATSTSTSTNTSTTTTTTTTTSSPVLSVQAAHEGRCVWAELPFAQAAAFCNHFPEFVAVRAEAKFQTELHSALAQLEHQLHHVIPTPENQLHATTLSPISSSSSSSSSSSNLTSTPIVNFETVPPNISTSIVNSSTISINSTTTATLTSSSTSNGAVNDLPSLRELAAALAGSIDRIEALGSLDAEIKAAVLLGPRARLEQVAL
jgi:hypothetical protein